MVSDNSTALKTQDKPETGSLIDGIDEYQDTAVRKVITKGILWKCAFRGLFMEGNFNFERMQGGGFAFSIIPGTAVAMEENKEKPSTVNVMKVAGMGPTGGIGDAIDHMTLMPLTLALGASIAMEGSIAGPFVFFFLYQIVHFLVYFGLMFMGYRAGTAAMVNMSDATEKLAKAANIMGIFVIGALSATFIKVQTTASLELGGKVVELQTALFDKIMPNLLPLCLVFLMYKMVKSTGFWGKPPVLIFSTLAFGVIGHVLGFL